MSGDLHTHSTFSDGANEIETLPFLASRAGLTHLAVSDHDTLLSARYAMTHPCQYGVTLLPAAELTGFDTKRGRRVHLLCYCPELTPRLERFCALMARRRNEACEKSIEELERRYPQFTREGVLRFASRSGVLYKTYLIRLLYEYGYTDGIYRELYHKLFGNGPESVLHKPAYETLETVLELIDEARGVCVLAHPSVYHSMELAVELAASGSIDGVEIEHPRNTAEDKEALRALAQRYGLLATGGTDFHGMHMAAPLPLGTCQTSDAVVEKILELAKARKK